MLSVFKNVSAFINYWWFRYLMVTELYMVEKWEQVTIHIIIAIAFTVFWYFNYVIVLTFVGNLYGIQNAAFKKIPMMDARPESVN